MPPYQRAYAKRRAPQNRFMLSDGKSAASNHQQVVQGDEREATHFRDDGLLA